MKMNLKGFKGKTRELFEKAFAYSIKRDGIENEPYTLNVAYLPHAQMPGPGVGNTLNEERVRPSKPLEMYLSDELYKCGGVAAILETFFHELKHVAQMVKGELTANASGVTFRGKFYPHGLCAHYVSHNRPEALPWETEAYSVSETEPETFLKHVGRLDLLKGISKVDLATAKAFREARGKW